MFDNDEDSVTLPDGFAIQKKDGHVETAAMEDKWWTEEDESAPGTHEENVYNEIYKEWLKEKIEGDGNSSSGNTPADYRLVTLPQELTSNKVAGLAVADGQIISLEKDNGDDVAEGGKSAASVRSSGNFSPGASNMAPGAGNISPQKLRIINSPIVCNFRNEIETTIGGKTYKKGFKDNKGLINGVNFSEYYEDYPCARICKGEVVIPFADTTQSLVDPRQSREDASITTNYKPIRPEKGTGISGAIRGISFMSVDSSGVSEVDSTSVDPYIKKGIIFVPNSAKLCNFRNEKEKVADDGTSMVDIKNNKGLIKSVNFSSDYANYPCARICDGKVVVPFADTTQSSIDPRQEMDSSVDGDTPPELVPPEDGVGITGAIRGIRYISDVDSTSSGAGSDIDNPQPYIEGGVIYIPKGGLLFDGVVLVGKDGLPKENRKFKDLELDVEYRIARQNAGQSSNSFCFPMSITMKIIKGTGVDNSGKYVNFSVRSVNRADYDISAADEDLNYIEDSFSVVPSENDAEA